MVIFLLNSTIGLVGIFDVATPLGIESYRTDFGQTLALWGVPEGPYLMLPLFGPRTVRSGSSPPNWVSALRSLPICTSTVRVST